MKTCLVVSVENAEGSDIRHVCLSEETARKKFYEVLNELINRSKERCEYLTKEGRLDDAESEAKEVKTLQKITYPGTNDDNYEEGEWLWDSPLVREHPLLD